MTYLQECSGTRLCDDCLTVAVNVKYRQQTRHRCMLLAASRLLTRTSSEICSNCGKLKICTSLASTAPQFAPQNKQALLSLQHWFWEGNVQQSVVAWLESSGWDVVQYANTAAKTPGKDIIARRDAQELWVTVKGYPKGTEKTSACTQARHWFSHATFDLICYRTESESVQLAMALPDCGVTYRRLVNKAFWAFTELPAFILWVGETGQIEQQF